MRRRDLLKYAGATALAAPFLSAARADQTTVRIGVVGPKTGPLAAGAAVTHFPPWRLWAHQVNEQGGLKLKDGQRKVELIEYDDRTQPPEAIKAVERLASVDKVDWIVGLYGTGFNVAAVPTFAKLGYPQIPVACVTELSPQLAKKYPQLFFGNGTLTHYCASAVDILKKFRDAGEIGNKVAMVNIADEYGIEISNISKTLFPASGFDSTNRIRSARRTMRRSSKARRQPIPTPSSPGPIRRTRSVSRSKPRSKTSASRPTTMGSAAPSRVSPGNSAARRRTSSVSAVRPTTRRPAPSINCTKRSPASTPIITAARSTTRTGKC
jgi:hypothetical protein